MEYWRGGVMSDGGIGFDHTNHQEGAVHLLRTYHVVGLIIEVAGRSDE
jgi:hypothetical protein